MTTGLAWVICTKLVPDHSTIAEFRKRHEKLLAELFTSVLSLCKEAGLVKVGVIAIDGTKIKANAHRDANKSYEQVVGEILAEADAIDRAEDEQYGDARGDELPEELRTPEGRRAALRAAKERLERQRGRGDQPDADRDPDASDDPEEPVVELDTERSWPSAEAVRAGCGRRRSSSTPSASGRRGRSRGTDRHG